MEIKIRNVDPIAVKKIDELAKKKKMSRQEFLKGQLETLTLFQGKTRKTKTGLNCTICRRNC